MYYLPSLCVSVIADVRSIFWTSALLQRGMSSVKRLAFTVSILALTTAAYAQAIPITNPSFENPATNGVAVATGWTEVNNSDNHDVFNPYEFSNGGNYYTGATQVTDPANGGSGLAGISGENVAFVFTPNGGAGAGISQTLSTSLIANQEYVLTVSVGRRNGSADGGNALFAGSSIQLLAGSTVIASSTDNVGPTAGTFHDQTVTLLNSNSFSQFIGQPLTIRLLTTLPKASNNQATEWDNVRLSGGIGAAAPESSSFVLFCWGIVGLTITIVCCPTNVHKNRRIYPPYN